MNQLNEFYVQAQEQELVDAFIQKLYNNGYERYIDEKSNVITVHNDEKTITPMPFMIEEPFNNVYNLPNDWESATSQIKTNTFKAGDWVTCEDYGGIKLIMKLGYDDDHNSDVLYPIVAYCCMSGNIYLGGYNTKTTGTVQYADKDEILELVKKWAIERGFEDGDKFQYEDSDLVGVFMEDEMAIGYKDHIGYYMFADNPEDGGKIIFSDKDYWAHRKNIENIDGLSVEFYKDLVVIGNHKIHKNAFCRLYKALECDEKLTGYSSTSEMNQSIEGSTIPNTGIDSIRMGDFYFNRSQIKEIAERFGYYGGKDI